MSRLWGDSFCYYGTDDLFINCVARLLRPGGVLAIAGSGLAKEITGPIPNHLKEWWTPDLDCLHSAPWWSVHWNRSNAVRVKVSDSMPEGWRTWLGWHRIIAPQNLVEIEALTADSGEYLTYVRTLAERLDGIDLSEPVRSLPGTYTSHPLLHQQSETGVSSCCGRWNRGPILTGQAGVFALSTVMALNPTK